MLGEYLAWFKLVASVFLSLTMQPQTLYNSRCPLPPALNHAPWFKEHWHSRSVSFSNFFTFHVYGIFLLGIHFWWTYSVYWNLIFILGFKRAYGRLTIVSSLVWFLTASWPSEHKVGGSIPGRGRQESFGGKHSSHTPSSVRDVEIWVHVRETLGWANASVVPCGVARNPRFIVTLNTNQSIITTTLRLFTHQRRVLVVSELPLRVLQKIL